MEKVFILEHIYVYEEIEEVKFIGVFSNQKSVDETITFLKDLPGFDNFSIDCFKTSVCKLDHFEWKSGFVNWEE